MIWQSWDSVTCQPIPAAKRFDGILGYAQRLRDAYIAHSALPQPLNFGFLFFCHDKIPPA